MSNNNDTPLYYFNKYGLIFYKSSDRVLSSDELSTGDNCINGFSSEGLCHLEKIVLAQDVTSVIWNGLGRHRFNCFEVDSNNLVFEVFDGVLYTKKGFDRQGNTHRKKMKELVACPTNVYSHDVIYGTTRIANCAFKGSCIANLSLPSTLEEIGTNAFYFADQLKSIEIPSSIRMIEPQLTRTQLLIRFDNHQFESWDNLFSYMLNNGFENNNNKIKKQKNDGKSTK